MREIQQPPRPARTIYGCDFCKRTNVRKETMEKHEKECYYNPDRECPICHGKRQWGDGIYEPIETCSACDIVDEVQKE